MKRNLEGSERNLLAFNEIHMMNSDENVTFKEKHIKINSENMTASETAVLAVEKLELNKIALWQK